MIATAATWMCSAFIAAWTPAPGGPTPAPAIADAIARLEGHVYTVAPDGASYTIDDVAGEGPPVVGLVERRGDELYLLVGGSDRALRLAGPLATPRIAGPGYEVWALGAIDGDTLVPRRLGVLSPP